MPAQLKAAKSIYANALAHTGTLSYANALAKTDSLRGCQIIGPRIFPLGFFLFIFDYFPTSRMLP
jgi:hypothetical protein